MSETPPKNPHYVMVFPLYFADSGARCQLSVPRLDSKEDFILLKKQVDNALTTVAATTCCLPVEYDAGTSQFRFPDDEGGGSNTRE